MKLSPNTIDAFDTGLAPAIFRAGIQLFNDGSIHRQLLQSADAGGEWWTGYPAANIGLQYQAKITAVSGTTAILGDAVGSWLAISTEPQWYVQGAGAQYLFQNVSLQIRKTSTGVVALTKAGLWEIEGTN